MQKFSLTIFILLTIYGNAFSQKKIAKSKTKVLIDSLYQVDQQVQEDMIAAFQRGASFDSIKIYEALEKETFRRHIPILKKMVNQNSYPTVEQVGLESSAKFFTLVQHSDNDVSFQAQMLPFIKKQTEKKEVSGKEYAYLYDRIQINSHKQQLYGTQLAYDNTGNAIPKSLQDSLTVNSRREQLGMETLESYLAKATELHKKQNKKITQQRINYTLKKELDSMYTLDQKYRELLFSPLLQTKADSIADYYKVQKKDLTNYLMQTMQSTDSQNINRIDKICAEFGYPGKSLVDTPTNEAAFYVIQHSQSIDKYLPVVKQAAESGELPFELYAMMLDRSLMYKNEEQVYGTQGKGIQVMNAQTGKKEFVKVIWPIKNPGEVNERRKQAGFGQTVEENAKRLNIEYKVFSLEDIKKMQAK